MEKINFKSMKIGDKVKGSAFVLNISESVTKTGSTYTIFEFNDGQTIESAKCWASDVNQFKENGISAGVVVDCDFECDEYRGARNFKVSNVAVSEDQDISDYVLSAPVDSEKMYETILQKVREAAASEIQYMAPDQQIIDEDLPGSLYELTLKIYQRNKEKLLTQGGAMYFHHNMRSGLLYHTYRMVLSASALSEVYTNLSSELFVAAAALHDVGKLVELETALAGTSSFTTDGTLFGHTAIGLKMVEEAAREGGDAEHPYGKYNPEKVRNLLHCIASHHGKLEWGAIVEPRTAEAWALFNVDYLDSHIEMYEENYANMEPGATSDKKVSGLDTYIYKPDFD